MISVDYEKTLSRFIGFQYKVTSMKNGVCQCKVGNVYLFL